MKEVAIKDRITCAAREMFLRHGAKSVSMDDIAGHLGVSKKTIYAEFDTKEDLLLEVVKQFLENKKTFIEVDCGNAQDAIEESFAGLRVLERTYSQLNSSLLFDIKKFHPRINDTILSFKENVFIDAIEKNLQRGIEEGLYRDDININLYAHLKFEMLMLAFDPVWWEKLGYNFSAIHKAIFEIYHAGISTTKGQKLVKKYLEQLNKTTQ